MDKAFIKNPVEAYEKLKEENKSLKESLKLISQTLNHTLQSEVDLYKRQIDNSVPDDWEYEEVLALVEEYIEKLKVENEKLKEKYLNLKEQNGSYIVQLNTVNEQLNQLKEENEEWKNKLTKSIFEDGKKQIALDIAIYERDKFKQALTEIKEIAKNDCYDDCGMPLDELGIILQKINEVEDVSSGS